MTKKNITLQLTLTETDINKIRVALFGVHVHTDKINDGLIQDFCTAAITDAIEAVNDDGVVFMPEAFALETE